MLPMLPEEVAIAGNETAHCYHAIAIRKGSWLRTRCGKDSTRYVLIDFPTEILVEDYYTLRRHRPCRVCYPSGVHILDRKEAEEG